MLKSQFQMDFIDQVDKSLGKSLAFHLRSGLTTFKSEK